MTEKTPFSEEVSNQILKDLQSRWEIPSTAQYISLFREPFNLPEIEIEELENGLIEDTINGPSTWLRTLLLAFLRTNMPGRINAENWEQQLRKLVKRKLPIDAEDPWPDEDKAFHELNIGSKVDIVYSLCLARLDRNDIQELMKSMDAEALRVQKLGSDDAGSTYWYFYGTRLYKEEAIEEKKSWNEEWKEQKKKSFKKRGRGRPRKRIPTSDGESDSFEDIGLKKNDSYMNVSEKSRWSVVCDTIEEWLNFAEKFKNSKSKNESSLFKVIQENFLPTLSQIYEEKEKKLQQKIRDLMPSPTVTREKIVTRREARRMNGEEVERPSYSDYFNDDPYKTYTVRDRAQRLEERNKRASEADCIQISSRNKRMKNNHVNDDEIVGDEPEYDSSFFLRPEIKDIDWQADMERLLSSVKLHKDAWPFLYPVNEDDAPGYKDIIKDPVDLSMIENKLFEGHYADAQELDDDFSKMVSNCELYNGEYHPFSKMGHMLWKYFRDGVAKIFKSLKITKCADSEGSSDSQYHSSPNSVSPPLESPTIASTNAHIKAKKEEKKERKKRKKRRMDALNLLAEASDLALQNSNSNDMLNVANMYDVLKKSNDFPNLKIMPIHSNPSSVVEKLSSSASQGSPEEHDSCFESSSPYLNQEQDVSEQYIRTSPTISVGSNESTNYINNLTQLTNFFEKGGVKNFNLLTNGVLSDGDSNQDNSSAIHEPSNFPKGTMSSDNLQSFDNLLEEYNENFISNLIKQPALNSEDQRLSHCKENNSQSNGENLPKQDTSFSKNLRKNPQTSDVISHSVADNVSLMQDSSNLESNLDSPSSMTTVDASVLGITYNPFSKKPGHFNGPMNQNHESFLNNIENTVPNIVQGGIPPKNVHNKSKSRTSPNEFNHYSESSGNLNYNQAVNVANPLYPSANFETSTSYVPTTAYIQTLPTNSISNLPLQVPATYPKSMQQSMLQVQNQNSTLRLGATQPNGQLMYVPGMNIRSEMPYQVYTQNKLNQHVVPEQFSYLPNFATSAVQMAPSTEKRILNYQDNFESRTTPPQKKSPVPQQIQGVPSTNMPCYSVPSTSFSNHKTSLPVTSSNFVPTSNFVQKSIRPLVMRPKIAENQNRISPVQNVATTSVNVVSSTNTVNSMPQNSIYQSLGTKTVPLVFSTFNHTSPSSQNDVKLKNNPGNTTNVQSSVCIPNGLPVVQQVMLPAGAQQIQLQNNGQFVFTSPQNTVRLFNNKEQNVQVLNNGRPVNQGFGKVVPQMIASAPVIQVSKPMMSGLQFQAVAANNTQAYTANNTQAYTQVTQAPQFVNIPTYMLTNQNTISDSSSQPIMNIQPYQLPQRQLQINSQGNS